MTRITTQLQTYDGVNFVNADGGGGGIVKASEAQALTMLTALQAADSFFSGSKIYLRAANGMYLCAVNGGGCEVVADRTAAKEWETFRIERVGGGTGVLRSGDRVNFRTYDGMHFLCAVNGGGCEVVADRTAAKEWETFRLLLYPNHAAIPVTDASPPSLNVDLRFSSRAPVLVSGGTAPTIHVSRNEQLVVTATGTDPAGGVRTARIGLAGTKRSSPGQLEQGSGSGWMAENADDARGIGDLGAQSRSVVWCYDMSSFTAGWTSASMTLHAEALDFSGKTAAAWFTVCWP